MANLTDEQIKSYASGAGFAGNDLNIAVAVARAESGGNPNAHNSTPPDDSYGLWQINMYSTLGPSRRKQFGISKNEDLFNPALNAKAAHTIFQNNGWKAWTTYTRGTYKQYLNEAETASASGGGFVNTLTGIPGALNAVGINIFKGLSDIVGVILAIALIIAGIAILVSQSKTAKSAVKTAVKVIP